MTCRNRDSRWQIRKKNGYWWLIPPGRYEAICAALTFGEAQRKFPEKAIWYNTLEIGVLRCLEDLGRSP